MVWGEEEAEVPLVPKFYLGTQVSAKLRFAMAACGGQSPEQTRMQSAVLPTSTFPSKTWERGKAAGGAPGIARLQPGTARPSAHPLLFGLQTSGFRKKTVGFRRQVLVVLRAPVPPCESPLPPDSRRTFIPRLEDQEARLEPGDPRGRVVWGERGRRGRCGNEMASLRSP